MAGFFYAMETSPVGKPKPTLDLTNADGNAFVLIAAGSRALRASHTPEEISQFREEATSGDYNNVLMTLGKWCDVKICTDDDDDDYDDDYDDDDDDYE